MSRHASKPTREEIKQTLNPLQFNVTQQCGTEPAFSNEYWDNHQPGIYVDVVTGEPLFSSNDKFDSGTGWPSFTRPIEQSAVVERQDQSAGMTRIEVRSHLGDSHLGHVFDDGPKPTGQRYCINSAALRFVPVSRLAEEGYGEFLPLFATQPDKIEKSQGPQSLLEIATLAGGCFWGMEDLLRKIPGVVETEVGYTGGDFPNATYQDVHTGKTGHAEAVRITFDPKIISYQQLLEMFFRMHDPTTPNRQGNDRGSQYRSAIFYHSPQQKLVAEQVRDQVDRSGKWLQKVMTQIVPAGEFWNAEEYHQDYLQKNPGGYTCHFLRD